MKRYPAYDPPEYVDWTVDPDLLRLYIEHARVDPQRRDAINALSIEQLLDLYRNLLLTRLHDVGLKRWVKQGVISKAWLGTGEEAVTVGPVAGLKPGRDVVMPMIRNSGACFMMGMPMADIFRAYLATSDSPSKGRDLHAGRPELGVYQPVSQMGMNVPVMTGVALAFRNRREARVAMTWIGDGATRSGECHEGANFAAVQNLPIIFVIQNNQVALGTRTSQHSAGPMEAWPDMYGIPSYVCDGNHVLDLYAASTLAVERCRRGEGPVALVANTFRMGGHATHDEREARETFPEELFKEWGQRDPIGLYEAYLLFRGVTQETLNSIETECTDEVEAAANQALASRSLVPEGTSALYPGFSQGGVLAGIENRPVG